MSSTRPGQNRLTSSSCVLAEHYEDCMPFVGSQYMTNYNMFGNQIYFVFLKYCKNHTLFLLTTNEAMSFQEGMVAFTLPSNLATRQPGEATPFPAKPFPSACAPVSPLQYVRYVAWHATLGNLLVRLRHVSTKRYIQSRDRDQVELILSYE